MAAAAHNISRPSSWAALKFALTLVWAVLFAFMAVDSYKVI